MILLDTDTLSLLFVGHARVCKRLESANDEVAITIVTRIEVLQGRFDYLLKAADGAELSTAQSRLEQSERDLSSLVVVPVDEVAARTFDRLRNDKPLRKIGRADLLIASIALAQRATLVTRNVRHFRQISGLLVENWVV